MKRVTIWRQFFFSNKSPEKQTNSKNPSYCPVSCSKVIFVLQLGQLACVWLLLMMSRNNGGLNQLTERRFPSCLSSWQGLTQFAHCELLPSLVLFCLQSKVIITKIPLKFRGPALQRQSSTWVWCLPAKPHAAGNISTLLWKVLFFLNKVW